MNFTATTPLGHVTLSLNASCTTLTGAVFDHPIKDAGEKPPLVKEAQMQLDAYFDGSLQNFTLPLSYTGTCFQKAVWQAILEIPYGRCQSYTFLAEKIKRERAVRAIGHACAKNPLAIFIPCHRIIHKSGYKKGYTWGDSRKIYLLKHEEAP